MLESKFWEEFERLKAGAGRRGTAWGLQYSKRIGPVFGSIRLSLPDRYWYGTVEEYSVLLWRHRPADGERGELVVPVVEALPRPDHERLQLVTLGELRVGEPIAFEVDGVRYLPAGPARKPTRWAPRP